MIRTRFAPSPTGFLHVGGLRTALFNYLFAKKNKGVFLLRIEDTDRERYVEGGIDNILKSLHWVGIEPDNDSPYIQSERLDIYKKYAENLIISGQAYYCFCSKDRLEKVRKIQELSRQPTGYDGHCREIPSQDAQKRVKAGESHVIRMKMPKDGTTKFKDSIRGNVEFDNKLIDDQILLKTDGYPTYHLAVVVDDYSMKITHVIRGEEWLSSTPKHIQLYKMLGWKPPQFAHLPLLLNPDKSKLSKRQGDVAVEDYIQKGYLPEALINFTAFLGWNPGSEKEIFSLDELSKEFSLEKVNKAGAVFNLEKLNWYNREYLKKMNDSELAERCKILFENKRYETRDKKWLEKVVALEKERATTLSEIVEAVRFVFEGIKYPPELLIWKKSTQEDAKIKLQLLYDFLNTKSVQKWDKKTLESKIGEWMKEKGFGTGEVLWPMRVALSGQQNSPGPFEIAEVLGKEKALERIKKAINLL